MISHHILTGGSQHEESFDSENDTRGRFVIGHDCQSRP